MFESFDVLHLLQALRASLYRPRSVIFLSVSVISVTALYLNSFFLVIKDSQTIWTKIVCVSPFTHCRQFINNIDCTGTSWTLKMLNDQVKGKA